MDRLSRSVSRVVGALALACLVVLAGAPSAVAADRASISYVESSGDRLEILVSVPPGVEVDLDAVGVTIDGEPADTTAVDAASATQVRRTAVLVMDTSNSMRGARFEGAQNAARAFLDSVPDDVFVGIVSFAGTVTEALEPTLDRDAARAVVDSLELSRKTRLYEAVLAAVTMAGDDGQRNLVVLSDGADTTDTPLTSVTEAISGQDVLVDVVSVRAKAKPDPSLLALAEAGEGAVIGADAADLAAAFSAEAEVLARQILVTARIPAVVEALEATVAVSLPVGEDTLSARAFTTLRTAGEPDPPGVLPSASDDWSVPAWTMYAGVAGVGVGLIALLVLLVPPSTPHPMSAERRVATYTERLGGRQGPEAAKRESDPALAQAKQAAATVLGRSGGLEQRIAVRLEGAGSNLRPAEWLLVHTAIFAGSGAVGLLLGAGSLLTGIFFLVLGAVLPWIYLGLRQSRRRKAFNASLPDTLQLMSGSLAAGLSLQQSVDTIVREGVEPIGSEFKRVLVETRLGVSLEDAFDGVAERFDSKDFAWVVMAIKIQRQVGGNLAELLETVAGTMREREYMRRQVDALAAEGKLSAWVLGGLPPVFLLYLVVANRDYVMPLFTEPLGWLMLLGAGVLLSLGVFWMSRLIKVEV
ncbi:type II secretion system F family protein [Nocardioides sp.]|uniref:type II secretion system F family protein n=1 Tax=Nocardioides sp. TaxID=35761 RepID=UPI00356436C8